MLGLERETLSPVWAEQAWLKHFVEALMETQPQGLFGPNRAQTTVRASAAAVRRSWNLPRRPKMLRLAKRCGLAGGLPQIHRARLGNPGTRSIHPNGPIKQFPVPKGKFDILFWGRDEFSCIALQRLYEASERVDGLLS
jgi:hypothetical protein